MLQIVRKLRKYLRIIYEDLFFDPFILLTVFFGLKQFILGTWSISLWLMFHFTQVCSTILAVYSQLLATFMSHHLHKQVLFYVAQIEIAQIEHIFPF
jgi:hypothetical protein